MGKESFWKTNNFAKVKELEKIIKENPEITKSEIAQKMGKSVISIREAMYRYNLKMPTVINSKYKNSNDNFNDPREIILNLLRKRNHSVGELSRHIDKSKETIIKILDDLRNRGYDVKIDETTRQVNLEKVPSKSIETYKLEPLYRNHWRFGVISDTHIGSKYQQKKILHTCYKIGEQEKIDTMFHCGDVHEGKGLYRGQDQEIFAQGIDEQLDYAINNYPYTKKFKTYMITGSHDLVFKKTAGFNIVRRLCEIRKDLIFRGDVSAEFIYKNKNIRVSVNHPSGGLSYAVSYNPQKIVENITSAVISKIRASGDVNLLPNIFLFGHYHRVMYVPYFGAHIFCSPALQMQTPYLAAKGYSPQVGMLIIQINFDDIGNITKMTYDFRDFSHLVEKNDY